MKKQFLFLLTIVFFFGIFSCNDDSDLPTNESYLEITINGNTYDTKNGGIRGYADQETCDGKDGFLMGAGQIETSKLFFEILLSHYENLDDFESVTTGQYSVSESYNWFKNSCNFDIEVEFDDYTQSDHNTNLKSGGTNTITSIKRLDESSTDVNYAIKGNFSCVFINDSGEEISVTGEYNVISYVLK